MTKLADQIKKARLEDQAEHGKCGMCQIGDLPDERGFHRGVHRCGNAEACALCHGCLPPGEMCRNCNRLNVCQYEC